ncbi:tetratricopeptide repeat protein 38-like [Actinia tenebrosa]|uniref:Tetratricopeptide repeat protein 38 n=1 Tax=Actinia tenebrosa TaxID=6105 RepID=A0A6P8I7E4_ACTTE|nr:tetratricopeptide repeat protein 38-like [Actinia tenebrosa]
MSYYHSHWRDLDAWKKEGLIFSTPSNEAAKLYDGALTQIVQYYTDESLGGLDNTIQNIIKADPNFVMGYVLKNGMKLMSTYSDVDTNPELKQGIDHMMSIVAKGNITEREKRHALAFKEWSEGNTAKACLIWEDILTDHPTDMFALKMCYGTYIYIGMYPQLRDSVARVFPAWKPELPFYSYLHGMYAFGLEETGFYHDAEKHAIKGLELNPHDCWATHTRAHIFETTGRQDEGIDFMCKTEKDWTVGKSLAGHNYWHLSLYHIEKGDYETALSLFDSEVGRRVGTNTMFEMLNASSLLYRLQMEGVNVGDRWTTLMNYWQPHIEDQIWIFQDVHMMMCTLGAKRQDLTLKLLESLRNYVRDGTGTNCEVTREVGVPLCEAFELADKGHFDQAVELLKPIRYNIVKLGGSNAQRDVFNIFLINTAIMSPRQDHQRFARRLLSERKALKENSPLTERLVAKAMANHLD